MRIHLFMYIQYYKCRNDKLNLSTINKMDFINWMGFCFFLFWFGFFFNSLVLASCKKNPFFFLWKKEW